MRISHDGLSALKVREGVVLTMYRDSAGLPSIGCGHLLTRDELSSGKIAGIGDWHRGLTRAQVDELLERDLAKAERGVSAVRVPLNQNQHDALVSFAFNIGTGEPAIGKKPGSGFLGSTLLRLLNAGLYDSVPEQMRRWIHSGGKVDPILETRRESEILQWDLP